MNQPAEGATPSRPTEKLYVVIADCYKPGIGCAMAVHAARLWAAEWPEDERRWYEQSNTIVVLEHHDVHGLTWWLEGHGVRVSKFTDDEMLSDYCPGPHAIACGNEAKPFLRSLKLAFR